MHPGAVNEADVPNVVAGGFGGRAPRTHISSDLACVRVGASWNYVCLLVDPCNREIVGHSAGPRKDARPVKPAFATPSFPISDIEVFHTDRGSEFDNAEIDPMLEAFGIERSLSAKGCPHGNVVDESTDRILKAGLVASSGPGSRTTCAGTTTSGSTRRWATCLRSSSGRRDCPSRNRPNRCCQSRTGHAARQGAQGAGAKEDEGHLRDHAGQGSLRRLVEALRTDWSPPAERPGVSMSRFSLANGIPRLTKL